ncbi:AP-3 complex subunit delta [Plasmodium gonderi]|uniref:AP-3 complex subunit delta n=1 Tax=Plasmodium gonderi TaxID=77519 RepID=A0A1Y1J8X7_PLAGO|nr:AP-3 complex subunit delta [Plasmodium gonderi]GAW78956.1 AP-3 complex subunit delta [Plasmodium gonderi]
MNGSFIEMIKDIKRDDSIKNVEKNYELCVNSIKEIEKKKKKKNEHIFLLNNSTIKEKSIALLKLLYLQMFGKKIDPEHNFAVIEILTCDKYILKRRAHLFLHNASDKEDIIFLSINLFKKELYKENFPTDSSCTKANVLSSLSNIGCTFVKDNISLLNDSISAYIDVTNGSSANSVSVKRQNLPFNEITTKGEDHKKNQFGQRNCFEKETKIYNTVLILNTVSNICTNIMSSNLYSDIFLLLNNSQLYIRKKTIISLHKLVICNLDILPIFFDVIKKNFIALYNNENPSFNKLPKDQVDYSHTNNNTILCCLIINILAEIFCTLEKNDLTCSGEKCEMSIGNTRNSTNIGKNKGKGRPPMEEANNMYHKRDITNLPAKQTDKSYQACSRTHDQQETRKIIHENEVSVHLKKFLSFIPLIYNILNERLSMIDNWKLIKIIKFLNRLVKYENRIYKKFLHLIVHIFFTSKAKSVIYECLAFLLINYPKDCYIEFDIERYVINSVTIPEEVPTVSVTTEESTKSAEGKCKSGYLNERHQKSLENSTVVPPKENASKFEKKENFVGDTIPLSDTIKGDDQQSNRNVNVKRGIISSDSQNEQTIQNSMDKLLYLCLRYLMKDFFNEDKNIVYMTTKLYEYIFVSPNLYYKFMQYNMISQFSNGILNNFYKDITIRRILLHILYYLMNENNFESIVYNILTYLHNKSESDFTGEYINVILQYGENHLHLVKNRNLYIFILFFLLCLKNHKKELDVLQEILRVNKKPGEEDTVHITTNFLSAMYIVTYSAALMKYSLSQAPPVASDIVRGSDTSKMSYANPTNVQENVQDGTNIHASVKTIHGVHKTNHDSIILDDICNFLREIKTFDVLSRYDIFAYITATLNMKQNINIDNEKVPYEDVNRVNVTIFEYLIYFLSLYLEETYNQIKEYKNNEFLNIFFFSLYIFFTHFSSSSILWYIMKIFLFFYQFEEHANVVSFYFKKLAFHVNYLIDKRDTVHNIDRCVLLRILLTLINVQTSLITQASDGIPVRHCNSESNFHSVGEFNFYSYLTDYVEIPKSDMQVDLDKPFKYDDSFFLHSAKMKDSQIQYQKNTRDIPSVTGFASALDAIETRGEVNTVESTTSVTASTSASITIAYDIPISSARNNDMNSWKGEKFHKDIQNFVDKLKEELKKWKKKQAFYQIHENDQVKLYFQICQEEELLRLYIQLVDPHLSLEKFNIYTSLQVKTYDVVKKKKEYEMVLIDDCDLIHQSKFNVNVETETNFHHHNNSHKHPHNVDISNKRNAEEENKKSDQVKLTGVENVCDNLLICVKFEMPSSFVTLSYDYFCNSRYYQVQSVHIPFVPLYPISISVDELTKVRLKNVEIIKKQNSTHRTLTHEIKLDNGTDPNRIIFSYYAFLAEYLHLFFFNMKNVFLNLQHGSCKDKLRLIFCVILVSQRKTTGGKTVLLINVQHKKKSQVGDICIYDIETKIKILNDSEDQCFQLLHYIQFYLTKLLSEKIKIKFPCVAVTRV